VAVLASIQTGASLREKIVRGARRLVEERHGLSAVVDQIERLLRETAERKKDSP